jgi:hypothetical protein
MTAPATAKQPCSTLNFSVNLGIMPQKHATAAGK